MIKYTVKIIDIKDLATGTKSFFLEKPTDFDWYEGAHIHLGHIGFDQGDAPDKSLVRHMSICTLPKEGIIGFTTRVPGSGSPFKQMLAQLKVGDQLVMFKVGSRIKLNRNHKPLVLLSMGVGIATMRPLILTYLENSQGISQLININVDNSEDFVYKAELTSLENKGYKNQWLSSRADFYKAIDHLTDLKNSDFCVVGSDQFILDTVHKLMDAGVLLKDISIDKKPDALVF